MTDNARLSGMRRRALDQLLVRYLELEHDDQQAFMERTRNRHPRLGRWLALMIENQHTISVLNTSYREQALTSSQKEAEILETGYRLGPWRIDSPVGRGGMGMVYRGRRGDDAFQMDVAIKLIGQRRAGLADLLRRECRLLALLDHPSITRLVDAGLDQEAGPFLVMEWVEGTDLEPWINAKTPATSERLSIFRQLVDAVAHAHQRLVVHGDIKPGNVRMRDDGVVKLMDFGVARVMDADEGESRLRALTPPFAAPEQLEGDRITPQSDLWSLGALLYWMLTGSVIPRNLVSIGDDLQAAGHARADELAAIVSLACHEIPGQRYAAVTRLGDDLDRFRRNEPLEAHAISRLRRGFKFIRRHPLPVGSATMTFLALVIGLAVSISMFLDARQAREAAALERDRAEQHARDLAQVAGFQTEQLAGLDAQAMGEVIRTTLFDQISQPPGSNLPRIALSAELDQALDEVSFTEIALTTLEQHVFQGSMEAIESQFEDQPEIQGKLLQTLVQPMREVGLLELAGQAQYRAIDLRREHLGPLHEDTLHSLHTAGNLELLKGEFDDAMELFNEALDGRRELLGNDHPDTLSTVYSIGVVRQSLGDIEGAMSRYRQALDGRLEALGPEHPHTIMAQYAVGVLHRFRGEFDEAMEYQSQALEGFRAVLGEDHRDTLAALTGMGYLVSGMGDIEGSLTYFEEALSGRRRVQGERHPLTLYSMSDVGVILLLLERFDEARPYLEQALSARREILGPEHPHTIFSVAFMARLHEAEGKYQKAEPNRREALNWRLERFGEEYSSTMDSMLALAQVLSKLEQHEEALEWGERAVQAYTDLHGPEDRRTLDAKESLASLQQSAEAEPASLDQ